jgi:A/G-specific adenine glycosylase
MNSSHKERPKRRAELLDWYERHKRDLPWRHTDDPYSIWVSEIMLQQTRVETVLPYYERFLNRYPSIETLAQAEIEEVLGLWSGLGYYRRARLLHQAARQLLSGDGSLPRDHRALRELPGVGAYTAAAIGSIAFGLVEPAVDGNVERVITRYLGIGGDPKRGEARREVATGARSLVDEERPGDSNQALMELGATICRPRGPLCSSCPLGAECHARNAGDPEAYPMARTKLSPTRVRRCVAIVRHEGRVLLFRRPEESRVLAGMWELPWVEQQRRGRSEEPFVDRYGGRWHLGETLGRVRHAITHRLFEIEVLEARLEVSEEVAEGREAGWFAPQDLQTLPVSSLVRKALALADSTAFAGGK